MVTERVGEIESGWARRRPRRPGEALEQALMRLGLLQRALRRRLLARAPQAAAQPCPRAGRGARFAELDAMAELLWRETAPADQPLMRNSS
jgi:hypothetical protein